MRCWRMWRCMSWRTIGAINQCGSPAARQARQSGEFGDRSLVNCTSDDCSRNAWRNRMLDIGCPENEAKRNCTFCEQVERSKTRSEDPPLLVLALPCQAHFFT